MGFITPSHSWEETDDALTVRVSVRGVPRSSFDVFAASCYLKVNAPPYLFSCDLEGEIVDGECVATIDDQGVAFRCPKATPGVRWGRLRREATPATRAAIADRRRASVEAAHRRVVAEKRAAAEAREKAKKAYQEKQWAIEQHRRKTIEARQDAEMAEERERIRRWQEETDRAAAGLPALDPAAESEDEDVPYDSDDDEKTRAAKEARTRKAREREFAAKILTPDALVAAEGEDAGVAPASRVPEEALDRMLLEEDDDDAARETSKNVAKRPMKKPPAMRPIERREMPPPRATTRVAVAFTKLETDHMPARAHREKEIREWKKAHGKKNARDPLDEDAAVNITEREPVFLKDKGDAFFRAGNYRSALEAYTAAVDAERDAPRPDGTLVRLYANRAACLLKTREFLEAERDCAAALDLLESDLVDADVGTAWTPEAIAAQRRKLLTRRAKARVERSRGGGGDDDDDDDALARAAEDLDAAAKLAAPGSKERETIEAELEDLRACAAPMNAAALRARGDERYRSGDVPGAMDAYSAVAAMGDAAAPAERAAALANRAACHLSRSDHGAAHDDCEEGLEALVRTASRDPRAAFHDPTVPELVAAGAEDAEAADARVTLLAKLLHRRAAAAAHLRAYLDAARDYRAAAGAFERAGDAPAAEALRRDAETVSALAAKEDPGTAEEDPTAGAARSSERSRPARDDRVAATEVTTTRAGRADARRVEAGDSVLVHAVGRIGVDAEGSGRVFWNTREPEEGKDAATPFAYVAGSGTVVSGWDAGAMGAREGEVRVLRVPAAEAYGDEGLAEWGIPPRADLTFELEVVKVNKRGA